MNKASSFTLFALLLLILLPSTAGRFLLDLAGGVVLIIVLLPILLGGVGWIGWKIIQSKMIPCEVCGVSSINNSKQCPFCGADRTTTQSNTQNQSIPASSATVDITAEDVDTNL